MNAVPARSSVLTDALPRQTVVDDGLAAGAGVAGRAGTLPVAGRGCVIGGGAGSAVEAGQGVAAGARGGGQRAGRRRAWKIKSFFIVFSNRYFLSLSRDLVRHIVMKNKVTVMLDSLRRIISLARLVD